MLFRNPSGLERNLQAFTDYYNQYGAHASLDGTPPYVRDHLQAKADRSESLFLANTLLHETAMAYLAAALYARTRMRPVDISFNRTAFFAHTPGRAVHARPVRVMTRLF